MRPSGGARASAAWQYRRSVNLPTAHRRGRTTREITLPSRTIGLTLLVLGIAAVPAHAGTSAGAARNCPTPKYPGSGYFTSLRATGTSCSTGKKVMLAHYRCRVAHGASGRCTRKVLGYSCTEKRNTISTEIDALVTCKRSGRKVVYSYQQNT